MRRCFRLVFPLGRYQVAVFSLLVATSCPGPASAVESVAKTALGADDACTGNSGELSGSCAVQALQQRSSRTPLTEPSVQPVQVNSSDWIWDIEAIKEGYVFASGKPDWIVNGWAQPVTMMVSFFCTRWLSYNWPKAAFWSQEVLRRTEALPAVPTPAHSEKMQQFVRKASFLTCIYDFDPQSGTDWSPHVAKYMKRVGKLPSTSLEMPMLDGWFAEGFESLELFAIDACMFWVTTVFCDIGHYARDMKGSMDYGDGICWDQVPRRSYQFTVSNTTYDIPFNIKFAERSHDFDHAEYSKCQEKPFTEDQLMEGCPMFGHYPDSMWGMGDYWSWGKRPEPDSDHYKTVMSCSSKLGVPSSTRMHFAEMYPYADNIGLMETPEWRKNATDTLKTGLGLE